MVVQLRISTLAAGLPLLLAGSVALAQTAPSTGPAPTAASKEPRSPEGKRYLSQPLVTSIYTADPRRMSSTARSMSIRATTST